MKIDVLCCGMLVADFSFSIARRPDPDEKIKSESFKITTGGPAANAALAVRLIGGVSELIATCSDDALGSSLLKNLKQDGFNTDSIIKHPGGLNVAAVLSIADGSRNVISHKTEFKPDALPLNLSLLEPQVLLLDGHLPELSLKLMEMFPSAETVLDAGSLHEGTRLLFNKVDWMIGSKDFALSYTGKESMREAVRELALETKNTIITDGGSGLLYMQNDKVIHLPAYKVEAIDSNGAGDVFHGAFSYGLANKFSFLENLKFSSAAAAFSCQGKGIRDNLPSAERIKEFINSH